MESMVDNSAALVNEPNSDWILACFFRIDKLLYEVDLKQGVDLSICFEVG